MAGSLMYAFPFFRAVELSSSYDERVLAHDPILKGPSDKLIEKVFGRVKWLVYPTLLHRD